MLKYKYKKMCTLKVDTSSCHWGGLGGLRMKVGDHDALLRVQVLFSREAEPWLAADDV